MSAIHFSSPQSTINFCDRRLDLAAANAVMKTYPADCLSVDKAEVYREKARKGEYPGVLGAIWKDKTHRLGFLDSLSPELHAPLMFEEALARFNANPTTETVHLVSIPLLKAAIFRVRQDAECSADASVSYGDADQRLSRVYVESLNRATLKHLGLSLDVIQAERTDERVAAITAKLQETAIASKERDLPSPLWVGWHGLSVFVDGKPDMCPQADFKRLRDAFADVVLTQLLAH